MITIGNISLPIDAKHSVACEKAAKKLGLHPGQIASANIAKISVDARKKRDIHFVCSVSLELKDEKLEQKLASRPDVKLNLSSDPVFEKGAVKAAHPPVVVGFGPAGMFAALCLAREGFAPIVLERGGDMDSRVQAVEGFWSGGVLNSQNNVQFGEGGAGTFSDGKLTTRIGDERCSFVLRQFVKFGAPKDILYRAKPHIGTDKLRGVVKSIREEIIALGGDVRFHTCLEDILMQNGRVTGVRANGEAIPTNCVVLAIGHSARDTFDMLFDKNFAIEPKPFSVGVRAEHLQSSIDRGLYGDLAGNPNLPVGEYQLSYRENDRGVYTFCMCPGGTVVPAASSEGSVVVNGMSNFARDGQNANSAVVVGVDTSIYGPSAKDGIAFQQMLEKRAFELGGGNYKAPVQTAGRFLSGKAGADFGRVTPTYAIGVTPCDFSKLFPPVVTDMLQKGLRNFGRKLPGYDADDTVLTGVETRTSSPIRLIRGEDLQALGTMGLYPCGEGCGYAGGIMSAACDGIKIAQQICKEYHA
ncbi:MAG: hypothetical protein IIX77_06590 [Oscillospiraceae bacterium]|nr:hypothetical protein [Oscillospiraceae bacterium]